MWITNPRDFFKSKEIGSKFVDLDNICQIFGRINYKLQKTGEVLGCKVCISTYRNLVKIEVKKQRVNHEFITGSAMYRYLTSLTGYDIIANWETYLRSLELEKVIKEL